MKTYKVLCKKKKTRYGNNRVIHTVRAISFLVGVDSGSVGVGLAVFYRGLGKKDEYISNVHSIKEETGSTEITVWTRKKKKKAPKKTKPFALAFNDDLMMAFYQGLQSTKESYDKMSESQKILAKKRLGGGGKTGYEIRETVAEWVKDSQNEALFIELYDNSTVSSTWFSVELDKARRAIELEKAGIKFGDSMYAIRHPDHVYLALIRDPSDDNPPPPETLKLHKFLPDYSGWEIVGMVGDIPVLCGTKETASRFKIGRI